MRFSLPLISILFPLTLAHQHQSQHPLQAIDATGLTVNSIPYSTRVHWMRRANEALSLLSSPCPFAAFGTVILLLLMAWENWFVWASMRIQRLGILLYMVYTLLGPPLLSKSK
ncbi:hypothetical protein E4T47_06806 [Aureobasidium subglaciale]|nr:hypothetical protein E4T47_06806 [Aureobasidium subglaciale]